MAFVWRRMYAFQESEPLLRPPPVSFSPPKAPPVSAPEIPILTLAIRGHWAGDLTVAARSDRTFPKDGDPEAVRKRSGAQQADSKVFQAVDDAENEWNRR